MTSSGLSLKEMKKGDSCSLGAKKILVSPKSWRQTPQKYKANGLLSDSHHGVSHRVQETGLFKHVFPLLMPSWLDHCPSLQGPLGVSSAAFGATGRGMRRAAHHLPQEILAIGASVSHYRTTARHREAHSQQSTPPRVPWKLF